MPISVKYDISDREKDIVQETERIRRQISVECQKQTELQDEINLLKSQLDESKQGLKAAARLTEQMEKSNSQVIEMKEDGKTVIIIFLLVYIWLFCARVFVVGYFYLYFS